MFSPPLPADKAETIARMKIGVINKIFLASEREQQEAHKAGAFNLLWSVPDYKAADGCLGEQQPSTADGASGGGGGQPGNHPAGQSAGGGGIAWQKGAYAIRFKGSEFVTTKALAHGGATGSGDAKRSRYDGTAGRSDVNAAMEPFQQPSVADAAGGDGARLQAATMWIAGPEAHAMEYCSQVMAISSARQLCGAD